MPSAAHSLAWPLLLAAEAAGALVPLSALPLRTRGRHVVDSAGAPVALHCVNWYGAHLRQMVFNGLNALPLADITSSIAALGFNCVRLPFSLDLVFGVLPRVPNEQSSLAANPGLRGLSPLAVFDATVEALTARGLLVILNNHVSSATWCCDADDGEGLWYTEKYPESAWLEGLGAMAARYGDNPRVAGFDLRNELRSSMGVKPAWGSGDPATDWMAAARRGGERVAAAKDMLIIVSGLHNGIFLCDVPSSPLHVGVPALRGRTVYTSHEYSWYYSNLSAYHFMGRTASWWYLTILSLWCVGLCLALLLRGYASWHRRAAPPQGLGLPSSVVEGVVQLPVPLNEHGVRAQSGCGPLLEIAGAAVATVGFILALRLGDRLTSPCNFDAGVWYRGGAALGAAGLLSLCLLARALLRAALALEGQEELVPEMPYVKHQQVESVGWWNGPQGYPVPTRDFELAGRTQKAAVHGDLGVHRLDRQGIPRLSGDWLVRAPLILLLMTFVAVAAVWYWLKTYELFADDLDRRWGFLLDGEMEGSAAVAPVWLGEFGTDRGDDWWEHMVRYIREHSVDWSYWSFNGEKRTNQSDTYGLLMEDYKTVRHAWKLRALQALMGASPPAPA